MFGNISRLEIPLSWRPFCYNTYSSLFHVNLSEISDPIDSYPTFNSFFTRKLKPDARPIDPESLVSPCDGRITSLGVASERLVSIKGRDYKLTQLLTGSSLIFEFYKDSILKNKENELYYVTIYLPLGDCHRFFVPCEWEIVFRRHMHGYLQGVFEWNLLRKSDVFSHNERVSYFGKWKFGAMHYVAVASFNIGDIEVYEDEALKTNVSKFINLRKMMEEININKSFKKGQEFGVFNAGSTIVLVFEAPKDLKWAVNIGDRVLAGSKLISD